MGIVLAFALFMAFIMFLVVKVQSDSQYDNEMVVEDYYKQERVLEERLTREHNAAILQHKLTINTKGNNITVQFPADFDASKIQGKVSLYRPSSQNLDFEIPISISTPLLLIPKSDLAGGRWDITIEWEYMGKPYLNKETLSI